MAWELSQQDTEGTIYNFEKLGDTPKNIYSGEVIPSLAHHKFSWLHDPFQAPVISKPAWYWILSRALIWKCSLMLETKFV